MASRGIQVVITGEYNDKDVKKAMGDLKALQSVGQIIGEVLRQLDEERCEF